jgi:UDP-N-acetylmuramoylalanine--D-glutamate ligase
VNKPLLEIGDNKVVLFSDQQRGEVFVKDDSIMTDQKIVTNDVESFCQAHQIPLVDLVASAALANELDLEINLEKIGKEFKKLPLRIELIGEANGVKFYNDSASTNPISTLKAVTLINSPMALILGGSSKGLPLDEFAKSLSQNDEVKTIYLFGVVRNELKNVLKRNNYPGNIILQETLAGVFAQLDLKDIKNVIFSPAFASFDQYKNYKERGEEFNRLFSQYKCKDI